MVDLSIVIVSWNAKKFLLDCIGSIERGLGNRTHETIVVDNGSTDGSPEAVEAEFPEVKVIRNGENLGFARANNIGIEAAEGRCLALINSDVLVLPACFDRLVGFLDSEPKCAVAGPRILNEDRSLQPSCREFPSLRISLCRMLALDTLFPRSRFFGGSFMTYWDHGEIREVDVLSGCFWMIRREAIESVGLLDEGFFIYGEDLDWCKRFREDGWKLLFYPEAEAIHFGGASSANAPVRFFIEQEKANLRYWRKHHGRVGQLAQGTILFVHQMLRLVPNTLLYVLNPAKRERRAFGIRRSAACISWLMGVGRQGAR